MTKEKMRKRRECVIALIWAVVALTVYALSALILQDGLRYLFILPAALIFYLLRLVILLPLSGKERRRGNRIVRLVVYLLLCAALLVGAFVWRDSYSLPLYPYLNVFTRPLEAQNIASIEHEEDGRFVIHTKNDELKVLQLTDLHIGGTISTYKQDRASFESIYFEVIEEAKPDLIIITGDLVYPVAVQSLTIDNRSPLVYICDFMEKIGLPWAFVYGNHDTEPTAEFTAEELNNALTAYTFDHGGHLLFSQTMPDVYGRYNNLIEVKNADGSLNRALFLLDSNDYRSSELNDYDVIHAHQIAWYRKTVEELNEREGRTVPSMLFFHIPIPEFEEAYRALSAGSADAELLFGERREGCACPDSNSGLFETVLKLGSTEAIFCGHDHLNDIGIRYKGVDLVYGRSVDHLAYPGIDRLTDQRGGTMVTLHRSGYEYTLFPKN